MQPPPEPSADPLDGSTWKSAGTGAPRRTRTRLPCLTVVDHPDVARIGERALLSSLRIRQPALVSRLEPHFAHPDGDLPGRPLGDRYVSRTPLSIAGSASSSLVLSCAREGVRCDGQPLRGEHTVALRQVERGVLIELDDRVALMLHLSDGARPSQVDGLLGAHAGLEQLRRELLKAAQLEVPVLIRGESGSGKERVARALHDHSPRAGQPFVAVNMATISEAMAVSVLFGHTRGAFTGATQSHQGLFERAHRGTLFLDEVAETPSAVQPMLLRVLETGTLTPLGQCQDREVDVRIVAATDADLDADTERGSFRRALFHRLAAYEVHVPTLRERREDILPLFVHFLREELHADDAACLAHDPNAATLPLPLNLVEALVQHSFSGNVRELRNLARQVAVASRGLDSLAVESTLERLAGPATDAPAGAGSRVPPREPAPRSSQPPPNDEALLSALEHAGWSVGRASTLLGLPTSTVYDLMRRCPNVRKAKDISTQELSESWEKSQGDTQRMAASLRVSERALKITLRERGLLDTKR